MRRSYRKLTALPAFGLYTGEPMAQKIIASIRAEDIYKARDLFRAHGLVGERVKRL